MSARTLSTADARREDVLEAAAGAFAARGFHGTPTIEVARAAGISQAYLFRLFPTKADLAIALVQRCNRRIYETFASVGSTARARGEDPFHAMGAAYTELLGDRNLLILQLHAHAASLDDPAIRDAMRDGFAELVALVERETGAAPPEVQAFFAHGMLCNVLAALDAEAVDAPWARTLVGEDKAAS